MAKKRVSKGLGDTVEKILHATGVDKLVHFIAGEDCGCEERKEKLNKIWKYKKIECLIESEHEFLTDFFKTFRNQVSPAEQGYLLKIYNRVFNDKQMATSCGDCWRDILKDLRLLHAEYKQD